MLHFILRSYVDCVEYLLPVPMHSPSAMSRNLHDNYATDGYKHHKSTSASLGLCNSTSTLIALLLNLFVFVLHLKKSLVSPSFHLLRWLKASACETTLFKDTGCSSWRDTLAKFVNSKSFQSLNSELQIGISSSELTNFEREPSRIFTILKPKLKVAKFQTNLPSWDEMQFECILTLRTWKF